MDTGTSSENCVMCKEVNVFFQETLLQSLAGKYHRIIDETEKFVAMPALGAFYSGYILIVPKAHITSFSLLLKSEFDELEIFVSKIKQASFAVYKSPSFIFEHGIVEPKSRRIEHAHLHVMPDSYNLGLKFLESIRSQIKSNGIPLKDFFDMTLSKYPVYIFAEVLGEKWLFKDNENSENRMHLRKKVAELIGNPEKWDFAKYPNQDFIQQTITDLKAKNQIE